MAALDVHETPLGIYQSGLYTKELALTMIRRGGFRETMVEQLLSKLEAMRLDEAHRMLCCVPSLPSNFRKEPVVSAAAQLCEAVAAATTAKPTASGRGRRVVACGGTGGTGKSVLASYVCMQEVIREAFGDGDDIFWCTFGRVDQTGVVQVLQNLVVDLVADAGEPPLVTEVAGGVATVRSLIAGRRCLLVFDDLWGHFGLLSEIVQSAASQNVLLMTTRETQLFQRLVPKATVVPLQQLSVKDACEMLIHVAGIDLVQTSEKELETLVTVTGKTPLAVNLVGNALHVLAGRPSKLDPPTQEAPALLKELLQGVEAQVLTQKMARSEYRPVFANISYALEVCLSEIDRDKFVMLGIFPEDSLLPSALLGIAWRMNEHQLNATLLAFEQCGLLKLDQSAGFVSLHDLQRNYGVLRLQDAERGRLSHERLLALVADHIASTPHDAGGWLARRRFFPWQRLDSLPPPTAAYLMSHLIFHLSRAGRSNEAKHLLLSRLDWIVATIAARGPPAAVGDMTRFLHSTDSDDVKKHVRQLLLLVGSHLPVLKKEPQMLYQLASQRPAGSLPLIAWEALPHSARARALLWRNKDPPSACTLSLGPHSDGVRALAFTPSGETLVSASDDASVRAWDVATGSELLLMAAHKGPVNAVCVSPCGSHALSASFDRSAIVWDLTAGEAVKVIKGAHFAALSACAWAGDVAATAAQDGSIVLWGTEMWEQKAVLNAGVRVNSIAVSSDGVKIAAACDTGRVKVWDIASQRETDLAVDGFNDRVTCVVFLLGDLHSGSTGDKRVPQYHVAAACVDGRVCVWNLASAKMEGCHKVHGNCAVYSLCAMPDGALASGGGDMAVVVTRMEAIQKGGGGEWKAVARLLGHTNAELGGGASGQGVLAAACSSKGVLVSGAKDGAIKVWDTDSPPPPPPPRAHGGWITACAFTRDGKFGFTCGHDGRVVVWDSTSLAKVAEFSHRSSVRDVQPSEDGSLVCSCDTGGGVRVWEVTSATDRFAAQHCQGGKYPAASGCAVLPDRDLVLSAGDDHHVALWRLSTGKLLRSFAGGVTLCAHPSGIFASVSKRGVQVWKLPDEACIETDLPSEIARWEGGDSGHVVAISPNGKLIATTRMDCTARVWRVTESPDTYTVLRGHSYRLQGCAFSSCSRLLATASYDASVRLWNVASAACVGAFFASGAIAGVAMPAAFAAAPLRTAAAQNTRGGNSTLGTIAMKPDTDATVNDTKNGEKEATSSLPMVEPRDMLLAGGAAGIPVWLHFDIETMLADGDAFACAALIDELSDTAVSSVLHTEDAEAVKETDSMPIQVKKKAAEPDSQAGGQDGPAAQAKEADVGHNKDTSLPPQGQQGATPQPNIPVLPGRTSESASAAGRQATVPQQTSKVGGCTLS